MRIALLVNLIGFIYFALAKFFTGIICILRGEKNPCMKNNSIKGPDSFSEKVILAFTSPADPPAGSLTPCRSRKCHHLQKTDTLPVRVTLLSSRIVLACGFQAISCDQPLVLASFPHSASLPSGLGKQPHSPQTSLPGVIRWEQQDRLTNYGFFSPTQLKQCSKNQYMQDGKFTQ